MNPVFLALSEGNEVASTMPEALSAGVTNAVTLIGDVFTAITDNKVLVIFLAYALIRGGVGVFRSMKHSVQ